MSVVRIHDVVAGELPTGLALIDEKIAPAIQRLNEEGTITYACCQGGGGETAYIALQT